MLKESINLKCTEQKKMPYSDCLSLGDFTWISGQIAMDKDTGELVSGDIQQQTRCIMNNILSCLDQIGLCACHIMRVTVYLTDMNEYDAMNEAYQEFFEDCYPARSVVGVNSLPRGAKIEIECYCLDTRALEMLCSEDCCCDEDEGVCCLDTHEQDCSD